MRIILIRDDATLGISKKQALYFISFEEHAAFGAKPIPYFAILHFIGRLPIQVDHGAGRDLCVVDFLLTLLCSSHRDGSQHWATLLAFAL